MYKEHPHYLTKSDVNKLLTLVSQLDIAPGPGGSRISDYETTFRVFKDAIATYVPIFDGTVSQIMVVALYPSSQLVGHKDPPIRGKRYHIPLQMNDGCWVHHDGVWVQLQKGHIYEMNPAEFHGAVNWGHEIRLHLAIDVY
jgi:hypothetical protein